MLYRIALLILLVSAPLEAQQTRSHPVLDSIARLALERNLGVKRATERERASAAGVNQARGMLLPSLGVDARYSRANGLIDIGDLVNPAYAALNQLTGTNTFPTNISATLPLRQETRLRLVVPVFNRAMHAGIDGAESNRNLRRAELDLVRRELDANARLAWINWASAARAVEVWDATLIVLRENLRVAQRCVDAGSITPDAVQRARAATADVEQQRAEAIRLREAARGAVNLLLDQPDEAPLSLPADAEVLWQSDIALDAALQSGRTREERRAVMAAADGARAQGKAANSAFLPSLTFAADYGIQGNDYAFDRRHDVAMASVVLSWNLFNGGQDVARRQAANAASREASLQAAEVDRNITLHVRTAWDAVQVARTAVSAAEARVNAAQSAFNLIDRRFTEGLASHLEWSDARAQLTASQLNHVLTRYQMAARGIELERAAALRELPNN
jgi:outer membrane protein TolC